MSAACPRGGTHVWTRSFQLVTEGDRYRVHRFDSCAKCGETNGKLTQHQVASREKVAAREKLVREHAVFQTRGVNVQTGPPAMSSYDTLSRSHRGLSVNLEGSC